MAKKKAVANRRSKQVAKKNARKGKR